jgi:hypothetical protein
MDNVRAAVEYSMRASQPEAAVELISSYNMCWTGFGDEKLDRLGAALRAADPARMSLEVLSAAVSQASQAASDLGRFDEAAAFVEQIAELRDQHPENLKLRGDWAFSLSRLVCYRAGGDRLQAKRLLQESQHAYEACGLPIFSAYAAGWVVADTLLWDCVDDPEVALAMSAWARLPQTMTWPELYEGLLQVIGGASDAYPSCLDAFTELQDMDPETAEIKGIDVAVAAELVGDYRIAPALALRFVRYCRRSAHRMWVTSGIRAAARLSATAGYLEQAVRLWAGADQIEVDIGLRYMPLMQRLDRPLRQKCSDAVGPDAARLLAEGASWSVAEATQTAEEALLRLQADNDWNETKGAEV